MAEIAAAVSLASSIVQLFDTSAKIIHRFHEFQRCGREVPRIFQNFRAELPLLQETLRRIKEATYAGIIGARDSSKLLATIDGCHKQIQDLGVIIKKTLPLSDDSRRTRAKKTIKSLCQESKVKHLTYILREYITTLTFYLITELTTSRTPRGTSLYTFN